MLNEVTDMENDEESGFINFENANSRDTYFTIHNVKAAHEISKGKGVKIGVLDHSFGLNKHKNIYAGGNDFVNDSDSLYSNSHHGYWMSCAAKEIAPESLVYALSIACSDVSKQMNAIVNAIGWAIENNLNVLTYSHPIIPKEYRKTVNEAVDNAIENNIATTFIHYDYEKNILPFGMCPYSLGMEGYNREPDVNIFHYDYNVLFIDQYKQFKNLKRPPTSGNETPFFSFSSMSPVAGGFVALLKSVNNILSPKQIKEILIKTSYKYTVKSQIPFENGECPRVVDIKRALDYLLNDYQ
jgi:hypothetical protein